jgi:hypothetical protein
MAVLASETIHYDSGYDVVTGIKTTQELKYSTTVWGSYIPLSEGYRAINGAVIWAGPPVAADERNMLQRVADGGLMSIQYRTWNVKRAAAFALGYRLNPNGNPPIIRRLWVDGSLAYSMGDSQPVSYNSFNQIYLPAGQFVNGVWVPNTAENTQGNTFGDAKTIWASSSGGAAGLSGAAQFDPVTGRFLGQQPVKSNITFRFYDGSESQVPDGTIAAALGADAPSFRGMMYIVIDDLVVGQGFETENLFAPDVNVNGATKTGSQTVMPNFPTIRVELVDGGKSTIYDANMLMPAGATGMGAGNPLSPNWDTSEFVEIDTHVTGGGTIYKYDMNSKSLVSSTEVTGFLSGERTGGFMLWDTVHDFYWSTTGFSFARSQVTISKNGNIISGGFIPGFDLGYDPSNGQPLSDTNPTDVFPHLVTGGLGYAIVNGQYETILHGYGSSNGHGCAIHLKPDGSFIPLLFPRQIIDVPPGHTFSQSVFALPLWVHATQDQHLSYQDCCFVHSYGSPAIGIPGGVRLVFVGIDSDGTTRIKGTQTVFTGVWPGSSVSAMMDNAGNLIYQEERSGITDWIIHKVEIDYLGKPDFSIAPGWRGLFPVLGAEVTRHFTSSMSLFGGAASNVNNNTYVQGSTKIDLSTLDITTLTGLDGHGLWDSDRGILYYNGIVNQSAPDPVFNGLAARWTQVIGGLNGDIPQLKNVLQDLSVAAGFTLGELSVDGGLTAGVPGVLITSPTDMGTLFNSMGAIYEFSYFNSGGKLTFRSSTNTPTYASGSVSVPTPVSSHINVQDGDTVTVGSITYRFKATPSAPFDVQLGVDQSTIVPDGFVKSIGNLYAAIKGDSKLGASAVPFFPGTVVNPDVTVKPDPQANVTNFGYAKLIITAAVGGSPGNSIALAQTGGRLVVSGSHLTNGAEPPDPAINITLDNLCLVGESQITETDALITTIPPPGLSQQAAAVSYYALEQDYNQLTQTYTPDNLNGALPDSTTTVTYALPIVMSTSEAYARVSHTSMAEADASIKQDFRLPHAYLAIEPNDVIGITIAPFQYTVRVDEATFNGDFSMSISATNFSARTDVPINNSDSRATIPQAIPSAGDAMPLVIDAPILNPAQGTFPGSMDFTLGVRPYYISIRSANFLMSESPQDPVTLFTTQQPVKWGKLGAPLPAFAYPGYAIVEDSITILCRSLNVNTDLQSATSETTFIAGQNCIAVGRPGNWEYIFFRDVINASPTSVTLKGLIRAQRGTDVAAANHQEDDYVVLMTSANPSFVPGYRQQSIDTSKAGLDYLFMTAGAPATKPPFQETDRLNGYSLYPFSPCLFKATLGGGNDITLAWTRRDRLSTKFVTDPALLSETSEKYDVEIMNGTTVVRTLTDLTTPSYTYTSGNQTADGFAPPMATIKFRVYQKGELGRGFPHEETVNVN